MIDKIKKKWAVKTPKKKKKKGWKKPLSSWNKLDDKTIKVNDNRKAVQDKLLKEEAEEDDIIKAHLKTLENHSLTDGLRVEKVAFAIFLALPERVRWTQGKFSKDWWISEQTLSWWKFLPEIQKIRMALMKSVLVDKTPAVMDNLFEAASMKNAFGNVNVWAVKLWLQFVEEWQESSKLDLNATGWFTINFGAGKSQFIQPTDESPKPRQ